MTRSRFLSLLVALAALSPRISAGQTRPEAKHLATRSIDDLERGSRVRLSLTSDPGQRLYGRLEGFGETTMIVDLSGQRRELPLSSILLVDERYRDRRRAAIVGAIAAVVGVYAWDFFGPHPRYTDQKKRYRENAVALAVSVPAAGLIGAAIGWPRWRPVNILTR